MTIVRYAVYFTPSESHPLTGTAAAWLGRNAFTGARETFVSPLLDQEALTSEPRRYGFHATLKAPFTLGQGFTETELLDALADFAARQQAFDIPEIVLSQIGPFFALVPAATYPRLQEFAADCVRDFEPFRAPLSTEDIARRKPDALSEPQRENLMAWGYPYVFDAFQFHMTLTGPVRVKSQSGVRARLEDTFDAFIGKPLTVDAIALFSEPERGAPFTVRACLLLQAK